MTFWCGSGFGSGSVDSCFWLMDPDADQDPAIFLIDLQDANKKLHFFKSFFAYYFLKDKKSKKSHKAVGMKVFLTIFAW